MEKPKVVPTPQEIEELDEFEDAVVEEQRPKKNEPSIEDQVEEESEDEELTEEAVKNALLNHEERIRRIEHHLRLDF